MILRVLLHDVVVLQYRIASTIIPAKNVNFFTAVL